VFPIAHHAATAAGYAFLPFAVCIAVAASCEFASPIGYQTNLMVMGPGGYRWSDYLRFGLPLDVLEGWWPSAWRASPTAPSRRDAERDLGMRS